MQPNDMGRQQEGWLITFTEGGEKALGRTVYSKPCGTVSRKYKNPSFPWHQVNQDNSFGLATRLSWKTDEFCFDSSQVQNIWVSSSLLQSGYTGTFYGVKQLKCEAGLSCSTSAKEGVNLYLPSPHAFMAFRGTTLPFSVLCTTWRTSTQTVCCNLNCLD